MSETGFCSNTVVPGSASTSPKQPMQDIGYAAQSGASGSAAVLKHTNAFEPCARPAHSISACKEMDGFLFFHVLFALVVEGNCFLFDSHMYCLAYVLSRQLSKPLTSSQVCITVSNSPSLSRVYIRLCKHRKRFLLLNYNRYLLGNNEAYFH